MQTLKVATNQYIMLGYAPVLYVLYIIPYKSSLNSIVKYRRHRRHRGQALIEAQCWINEKLWCLIYTAGFVACMFLKQSETVR